MDNAAQLHHRVLAIFLPVAATLYIGGEALSPKGTDQVVTTTATAFKMLPIAAQLYLASYLVLLGLGALAVSYGAIATLVRHRGYVLATVAALLGGLGAFCGAIINVVAYPSLAFAATAHVSRGAARNPGSRCRAWPTWTWTISSPGSAPPACPSAMNAQALLRTCPPASS
jgi:hypothetical protein